MDKKALSERDICTKFITPAIQKAGWDPKRQMREEVSFTKGRIIIKGKAVKRGKCKRADYILYFKRDIPIAVVEAKDNSHSVGAGIQQAIGYGEDLDIPFVFSSNGDGFVEHDRTKTEGEIERELTLSDFPSPQDLWNRYKEWKGITEDMEAIITQDYFYEQGGKKPRYYQHIAINRAIESVAKDQRRILLTMATGTGKTFVAFQILWRLWKARKAKRILYLADRNVLIDQTMVNDFRPFGKIMTKVGQRTADKAFEVYMALYQGLSGSEDWKNIYKEFSKDFFDLIVVDECHRGSAKVDSAWREILEYFSGATQIGMTATPKETNKVSNIDYFGNPIYTYSLKQGIEDGFLAPYRVIRVSIDKDVEGWRPERGQVDKHGNEIPDHVYNSRDFDRNLVIDDRTKLVARKVTEFLKNTDRYDKTIVFCVDIEHAERMRRALVNENGDLASKDSRYVMRITGDNQEGKRQLDNFIDPAETYPVIATTSKLMTTGVDAQTCKLIVLDSNIQSMTEFKQIIGRGTRIKEEYGKYFFTIMDFRQVTNHFADPDFDGYPVQIYIPQEGEEIKPPEIDDDEEIDMDEAEEVQPNIDLPDGPSKPRKYYVNNVQVAVLNERVQYYAPDGKLITESLKDYTKRTVTKEFRTMDEFLNKWQEADIKSAILTELEEKGLLLDALYQEVGKDFDVFDLICHVAYDMKPMTRTERARKVREGSYFDKYGDKAREVVQALLDKYEDEGIENIEGIEVLKVNPINDFGTPMEIVSWFGGKDEFLGAVRELESQLYVEA